MLQKYSEREALAREELRKAQKNAANLFTKESSQKFHSFHMERESIEKLIELARAGDSEAAEILVTRGRVARRLGTPVPACFNEFVWEWFLDGPPKGNPGSSPKDTGLRYQALALLVFKMSWEHGFPEKTPSDRRDDPDAPMSACRLVAEEFELSESWIEKIWEERKEGILRQLAPH
jgi:hypothetical protein